MDHRSITIYFSLSYSFVLSRSEVTTKVDSNALPRGLVFAIKVTRRCVPVVHTISAPKTFLPGKFAEFGHGMDNTPLVFDTKDKCICHGTDL
jgi:hypothetical protein